MNVWLDDTRPMPFGYTHHCKHAYEAIDLLKTGEVQEINLDYDLGNDWESGLEVAQFIREGAEGGTLPKLQMYVHSSSHMANYLMFRVLSQALSAWKGKR